jgi:hypothetical protein
MLKPRFVVDLVPRAVIVCEEVYVATGRFDRCERPRVAQRFIVAFIRPALIPLTKAS